MESELLFPCPAFPTAGSNLAAAFEDADLSAAMLKAPLLHDRKGSAALEDWHKAAGLDYIRKPDHLVIPDPNVPVEAVINEQGLALNDSLVEPEISAGRLQKVSSFRLDQYGYFLAYPQGVVNEPGFIAFRDWIRAASR